MRQLSQWRTWSCTLILGLMMLAALWLCPHDARPMVAQAVILGLGGLGAAQAAKSYGEHKENAKAKAAGVAEPPPPGTVPS